VYSLYTLKKKVKKKKKKKKYLIKKTTEVYIYIYFFFTLKIHIISSSFELLIERYCKIPNLSKSVNGRTDKA